MKTTTAANAKPGNLYCLPSKPEKRFRLVGPSENEGFFVIEWEKSKRKTEVGGDYPCGVIDQPEARTEAPPEAKETEATPFDRLVAGELQAGSETLADLTDDELLELCRQKPDADVMKAVVEEQRRRKPEVSPLEDLEYQQRVLAAIQNEGTMAAIGGKERISDIYEGDEKEAWLKGYDMAESALCPICGKSAGLTATELYKAPILKPHKAEGGELCPGSSRPIAEAEAWLAEHQTASTSTATEADTTGVAATPEEVAEIAASAPTGKVRVSMVGTPEEAEVPSTVEEVADALTEAAEEPQAENSPYDDLVASVVKQRASDAKAAIRACKDASMLHELSKEWASSLSKTVTSDLEKQIAALEAVPGSTERRLKQMQKTKKNADRPGVLALIAEHLDADTDGDDNDCDEPEDAPEVEAESATEPGSDDDSDADADADATTDEDCDEPETDAYLDGITSAGSEVKLGSETAEQPAVSKEKLEALLVNVVDSINPSTVSVGRMRELLADLNDMELLILWREAHHESWPDRYCELLTKVCETIDYARLAAEAVEIAESATNVEWTAGLEEVDVDPKIDLHASVYPGVHGMQKVADALHSERFPLHAKFTWGDAPEEPPEEAIRPRPETHGGGTLQYVTKEESDLQDDRRRKRLQEVGDGLASIMSNIDLLTEMGVAVNITIKNRI